MRGLFKSYSLSCIHNILFPESIECVLDNFFELPDFLIVESLEFLLPPCLRERPAVLPDEDEKVPGKPVSPSFQETIPASTVTPI
jgi:hypothetical protein